VIKNSFLSIFFLTILFFENTAFALECNPNKSYFGFKFNEKPIDTINKLNQFFISFQEKQNIIFIKKNGLMVLTTPWIDTVNLIFDQDHLSTILVKTSPLTIEEKEKIKKHLEEDYDFKSQKINLTFNETIEDIRGRKWIFSLNKEDELMIKVEKQELCLD
jgi:hypothetical protein